MKLYDEVLCQFARDNFRHGSSHGFVYKLAMGAVVATKKKRGRPRKAPVEVPAAKTAPGGEQKKRGRGRPPGSKNRPKEEVRAEKAAKRAAAAVKAAKKTAARKPRACKTV
jgi:hypothetical protein